MNPRLCCPTLTGGNHAMWCTYYDRSAILPEACHTHYHDCCKAPLGGAHLADCYIGGIDTPADPEPLKRNTEQLLDDAMDLFVRISVSQLKRSDKQKIRAWLDAYAQRLGRKVD